MSCGGGVGVCSPGGRSSTSWSGRWRHSRVTPGRSRRITRSATPSATTVGSSTSASAHTKGTRDAEATASAHNKALAVKRQGAGCARRAAHDGHEWGGQNSPSWRETRTERARGLGCGTELVCATSRCGARECTRHRAPRCAARWGVCVWGHLLQKHRCLDSGRVRGRARRVARALVASVGDTRGVWRTRVPRPCTCAASGPRAYVGLFRRP